MFVYSIVLLPTDIRTETLLENDSLHIKGSFILCFGIGLLLTRLEIHARRIQGIVTRTHLLNNRLNKKRNSTSFSYLYKKCVGREQWMKQQREF